MSNLAFHTRHFKNVGLLVAACERCSAKKTNRSLDDFLADDPERTAKIQQQINRVVPLRSSGHLNIVMPTMLKVLEVTGLPITQCDIHGLPPVVLRG